MTLKNITISGRNPIIKWFWFIFFEIFREATLTDVTVRDFQLTEWQIEHLNFARSLSKAIKSLEDKMGIK